MKRKIDNDKELDIKIQVIRELLNKKMEEKLETEEIKKISKAFDNIINYLRK
ncbi:hypothetical protein [Clostridium beijerinckii]|uniref:hypothetical protein n=1 Tax=Clostridium beijerinckii TaxID=1520 RepID=UPI0005A3330C|nr:hypothetical protein [Clostridium beijerinckii]